MSQNKLNFESENLNIHYICFNIQSFIKLEDIKKIAFYLFESFGFNSTLKLNEKTRSEILIFENENSHKVTFVKSKYDPVSQNY